MLASPKVKYYESFDLVKVPPGTACAMQEKTIAGPSMRDPRFPNVFPSSEMTPFWLFPGTTPGFYVGKAAHGCLTFVQR